ncbi:MAG TPA: pseudouridine synthase, partial [Planctomycetota bacterium]|nr:pseudouridine synthase [Planctomycetota bacterium]
MGERRTLDRYLSRSGVGSRAQAQAWIAAGRVRVDGRVQRDPEAWIDPRQARVTLDGVPVKPLAPLHLLLHKPVGYVTTRSDPEGRRTVYDLLGEQPRWVAPVGRLDRDTSGLLLFTNDSDLADRVTDPREHLPKTYVVGTRAALDEAQLDCLRAGVELADGPTRPAEVRRLPARDGRERIELVLREGRNRQVRRMLEAVGSRVATLERTAIGPLTLGGLASGAWRALARTELARLVRALPPDA